MDPEVLKKLLEDAMGKTNASTLEQLNTVLEKNFKALNTNPHGEPKKEEPKVKFGEFAFHKKLGEFALACKNFATVGKLDERLLIKDTSATGMNESDGTAGGFAVGTDVGQAMLDKTIETGILASRCTRLPISAGSNGMRFYAVDETSRADGSRRGGVQAYWENEADQFTLSKPKLRPVEMRLHKLTGLAKATDEMLSDAAFLGAFLAREFVNEFGFKIDDAIINGKGVGQPLGIVNSPGLVTVSKETNQDAATVVYNNVVKMYNSMPYRNRNGAIWVVNGEVEDQLPTLMLEGQASMFPAYMPPGGLSDKPYGTLRGRPVIPIEQCAALGTVGDIMFIDFSDYFIIEKGGIDSAVSIHLRFDYNEQVFRWTLRMDGQHIKNSPLTPYKGTKQTSTAVALQTRA